jgi:hypothetical protein
MAKGALMSTRWIAAVAVTTVIATSVLADAMLTSGAAVATRSPGAPDPSNFTHPKNNPYFPLKPGTVLRYRGSKDKERFREQVTVTARTKTIQGVDATVVLDVTRRLDGTLAEKTRDWYAADNDGNVWYLGEATATYDRHGKLEDREGSWEAGVDGAAAGTIMPADPKPTDAYRQEFYAGHAEDQAWIVQRNATAKVPAGWFQHLVRSYEWTRLDPAIVSVKFYGRGVGIVRELSVAGENEVFKLVSVSHR